ncbi:hypothetical protein GOBAR_DD26805 [Gossypium barbadense]|nr:hypothetical protein GOBAR_DD26805 [Gossypium barbadense]
MSETPSLVDFVVGANSTALNCGVGRAKLLGDSLILDGKFCMEKDFELQDEDVMAKTVNEIPSITFDDRVHGFIEKKMALSIVIKLLGRKIAFNTLLNKKGKSRDSSEVRSVSGNDHFKGFKVCCVGGRGEEIRADNHAASELNGAGVFEENSVMLLTRNETMVEGKKGVISSIRNVIDATGGKVGHTTFRVIEIDSHGTRSRKENNLFNFRAMGKEILGERSNGILEDSLNMRKPPDGKLGYNGQPTLDLSSVMEAIVGNLHQDLE